MTTLIVFGVLLMQTAVFWDFVILVIVALSFPHRYGGIRQINSRINNAGMKDKTLLVPFGPAHFLLLGMQGTSSPSYCARA